MPKEKPDHVTVTTVIPLTDLEDSKHAADLRESLGEEMYATALIEAAALGLLEVPQKPEWVDGD